jgi:hypothetical protein
MTISKSKISRQSFQDYVINLLMKSEVNFIRIKKKFGFDAKQDLLRNEEIINKK